MQPTFQSSFIPKKPVTDSAKVMGPITKNRNIFSVLASALFVITILVSGGLFGYQKILESQIKKADTELNEARAAFQTGQIQDLINASIKISSINQLLEKHFAVSELMILLQRVTLKTIKFNDFSFKNVDGTRFVTMSGEGVGFNSLAKQSESFLSSGFIKSTEFADFSLSEKGTVKFRFSGAVEPNLISYKESLKAETPEENSNTNQ